MGSVKERRKPKENLKLVSDDYSIGDAEANFKMYSDLTQYFGEISSRRDHENFAD